MSQPVAGSSDGQSAGGSSSKRAPRGAACLNCRRRKMKCDGERPICFQCIRTKRVEDCEYTDGPGPSPTQLLEDQIAHLESRIRELEHPELVVPSVVLNPTHAPSRAPSPPEPLSRPVTPDPLPIAASNVHLQVSALSQDPLVEPPSDLIRSFVNAFIPHSSSLSFFLNVPRFTQALQLPKGDPRRAHLTPALLNAVYLWGAHLSTLNAVHAHEPTLLIRATNALTLTLVPHYDVMSQIQAEVLIANYFFTMSRFLEGRYHCSAAVALALSCRLTKIRSSTDQGIGRGVIGTRHVEQRRESNLPPPRDSIEEGERIRGFWFVYALDKSWAVALGSPSHFNTVTQSGSHVDTPWPLEMVQYEAGGMPPDFRSAMTVHSWATGDPHSGRESLLSLRAKAATLFERATHLASQWSSVTTDRNEFYGRFMAVDNCIDHFIASLPPIELAGNPDDTLTSLVTHTLARAATIQLRSNLKDYDRMSDGKDLAAARAAASMLGSINIAPTNVDPILAILWTAVCRTLIGEILRFDGPRGPTSSSSQLPSFPSFVFVPSTRYELHLSTLSSSNFATTAAAGSSSSVGGRSTQQDALRTMVDQVLGVMNACRETSPLMAAQYAETHRGLMGPQVQR